MFLQNRCRIYQCELCVGSPANSLTTAGGQIRSSITFSSVHADPKRFLPTDDGLQNGPGQHRNLQGTLTPSEFPSQKHKFFALFFLKIGPEADSGPAHGSKYSRAKGKKKFFLKVKVTQHPINDERNNSSGMEKRNSFTQAAARLAGRLLALGDTAGRKRRGKMNPNVRVSLRSELGVDFTRLPLSRFHYCTAGNTCGSGGGTMVQAAE